MKRSTMIVMVVMVMVVLGSGSAEAQFGYIYNPGTYIPHGFGSGFGGYGGYVGLAMGVFQGLNQNRLVGSRISTTNRRLSMDEREQAFRHNQTRAQNNRVNNTALVRRRPIVKPKMQEKRQQQDFSKIVSVLKAKSPKAYQVYLDQRFAGQSREASLRKALETLKEENKDLYYALLGQMYDSGN